MQRTQRYVYLLAASVALAALILYLPALQNDFIDWDDGPYAFANPHIRSLDMIFFKWAFFDFHVYNWHPLTWISHALDYALWGLNPLGHHLTNVLLHAINSAVVVLLVMKLLEAFNTCAPQDGRSSFLHERTMLIAAGTTGLLFGLHPIHVESVAWVAERKDLLCALFFLLSIIAYVRYAREQGSGDRGQGAEGRGHWTEGRGSTPCAKRFAFSLNRQYLLSLVLFVLALMSKPMAVTLPFVLLILDWHPFNSIRTLKTLRAACVEKIPFIVLSIGSSILTILAQRSGQAVWEALPLTTRLPVAFKSLLMYVSKIALPMDLMPFYPHPRTASFLSIEYLAAAALVVGITITGIVLAKKQKLWLSLWCYFVATLLPVLGIVQAGGQVMADRYTYLPSLGPFLLVGLLAAWVSIKSGTAARRGVMVKIFGAGAALLLVVLLASITIKQIGIWKNSLVLWTSVIDKEPRKVLLAYYHRGRAYAQKGQYDKAIEDYNKVIEWNYEEYSKVYLERGLAYLQVGQTGPALSDLNKACDLGDDFGCKAAKYVPGNATQQRRR